MELTVKRSDFLKSIQKVVGIITNKTTLPILSNILLETENGNLKLTTTDLELRITSFIPADIKEEGVTTLPGKLLLNIINKSNGEEVTLNSNERHHCKIICGHADLNLSGLAPNDFPLPIEFITSTSFNFNQMEFSRIIDQVSYAVSLDDARKSLHGLLLKIKDNTFTIVATDGKRLALSESVLDELDGIECESILPLKSALELKRLLDKDGNIVIEFGDNQALFRTENSSLYSKLIEDTYPNYQNVIPKTFSKQLNVSTKRFLSSLELVSIAYVEDENNFIDVKFSNNRIDFKANSSSFAKEITDYFEVEYDDVDVKVSFNPIYILDPFRHSNANEMTIKMNDSITPVAIESADGFLYVIMPIRDKK